MRVALVTGGSRGIGRAIVREMAAAGLSVHFTWREAEKAAGDLVAEMSGKARVAAHRLDVRDAKACEALADAITRGEGALDVLVNNAGALRDGLFALQGEEDWREILDINLNGTRHCCRAAIRTMLEQRCGTIVNLTSIAGVLGAPGQTNYSAAKGAIIAFTKALAREVAGRGIQIHAVAPGLIDTDMLKALPADLRDRALARVPMGRVGRPEEVVFFVDGGLAM